MKTFLLLFDSENFIPVILGIGILITFWHCSKAMWHISNFREDTAFCVNYMNEVKRDNCLDEVKRGLKK